MGVPTLVATLSCAKPLTHSVSVKTPSFGNRRGMFVAKQTTGWLVHNARWIRTFASFQPPSLNINPSPEKNSGEDIENHQHQQEGSASGREDPTILSSVKKRSSLLSSDVREFGFNAEWNVYKAKSSVQFKGILPSFHSKETNSRKLRPGVLLVEIASSKGGRSYDWDNKIAFAMNVRELGEILAAPEETHHFIHDPGMNSSREKAIIKTLRVSTLPDKTTFFSFKCQYRNDESQTKEISIPLSSGEFAVFKTLAEYLIPRLLAFDKLF